MVRVVNGEIVHDDTPVMSGHRNSSSSSANHGGSGGRGSGEGNNPFASYEMFNEEMGKYIARKFVFNR